MKASWRAWGETVSSVAALEIPVKLLRMRTYWPVALSTPPDPSLLISLLLVIFTLKEKQQQ